MTATLPAGVFRKPWFGKTRYFISHSYRDAAARDALVAKLPPHVAPFIFPEIVVTPEQRVSDDLVREVRKSQGLVYLDGGESAASFWVAFERRFALGLGMPVIAFDPISRRFAKSTASAVDPPCSFVWNQANARDSGIVQAVSRWLISERRLDLTSSLPRTGLPPSSVSDTAETFDAKQRGGGTIVLFLSEAALADPGFAALRGHHTHAALTNENTLDERTLIVWTETPRRPHVETALAQTWAAPEYAALRQAILTSMSDTGARKAISLSEQGKLDWRRADDLMVRVEYLAFRIGGAGRLFTEDLRTIFDDMRERPVVDRPGML